MLLFNCKYFWNALCQIHIFPGWCLSCKIQRPLHPLLYNPQSSHISPTTALSLNILHVFSGLLWLTGEKTCDKSWLCHSDWTFSPSLLSWQHKVKEHRCFTVWQLLLWPCSKLSRKRCSFNHLEVTQTLQRSTWTNPSFLLTLKLFGLMYFFLGEIFGKAIAENIGLNVESAGTISIAKGSCLGQRLGAGNCFHSCS